MQRFHQFLFAASLVALSWFFMQAAHELGHVVGAMTTGGTVTRVVLHPLAISRTDVSPNPHPAVVVWAGPVIGCLLPLALAAIVPRRAASFHRSAWFVAGFCLVANGSYISLGSFDRIGDCGEMLRTGTPLWVLHAFGVVAVLLGLFAWHRRGSPARFFKSPSSVTPAMACAVLGAVIVVVVAEVVLSATIAASARRPSSPTAGGICTTDWHAACV